MRSNIFACGRRAYVRVFSSGPGVSELFTRSSYFRLPLQP